MYRVLGTNNQRGTFSFEIIDIVRSSTWKGLYEGQPGGYINVTGG